MTLILKTYSQIGMGKVRNAEKSFFYKEKKFCLKVGPDDLLKSRSSFDFNFNVPTLDSTP